MNDLLPPSKAPYLFIFIYFCEKKLKNVLIKKMLKQIVDTQKTMTNPICIIQKYTHITPLHG